MFRDWLLCDCKLGEADIFQCDEGYKNPGDITSFPRSSAYKWAIKCAEFHSKEISVANHKLRGRE